MFTAVVRRPAPNKHVLGAQQELKVAKDCQEPFKTNFSSLQGEAI